VDGADEAASIERARKRLFQKAGLAAREEVPEKNASALDVLDQSPEADERIKQERESWER
jgi:hypothetical protein